MPSQYKYKAVNQAGKTLTGVVNAQTTEQVEKLLQSQNLYPVRIDKTHEARSSFLSKAVKGNSFEQIINFTNQLATLHRAGIPLLRALDLIKIPSPGGRFNYAIEQIRISVQSGKLLSEAMAQYPDIFSPIYVAGIMAGEESGKLEQTLDELSHMLEQEMEINRHLKAATRYPIIVLGVIAGAIVVVMTFVIPRFVAFYGAFNADLPLPTKVLIGLSNFITGYWPIALSIVFALGFGFWKFLSYPPGRRWIDEKLLKLPVLGDLIIKSNIARFALMFKILFRSGVPIVKSLDLLVAVIKNTVLAEEIVYLRNLFQKGQDLSGNLGGFKYFPEMALQLMSIGLESGSLDRMLEETGAHYTKEVQYKARHMTSLLEPFLTLVLGAFVLLLALAIFLPMWNLIHLFKG